MLYILGSGGRAFGGIGDDERWPKTGRTGEVVGGELLSGGPDEPHESRGLGVGVQPLPGLVRQIEVDQIHLALQEVGLHRRQGDPPARAYRDPKVLRVEPPRPAPDGIALLKDGLPDAELPNGGDEPKLLERGQPPALELGPPHPLLVGGLPLVPRLGEVLSHPQVENGIFGQGMGGVLMIPGVGILHDLEVEESKCSGLVHLCVLYIRDSVADPLGMGQAADRADATDAGLPPKFKHLRGAGRPKLETKEMPVPCVLEFGGAPIAPLAVRGTETAHAQQEELAQDLELQHGGGSPALGIDAVPLEGGEEIREATGVGRPQEFLGVPKDCLDSLLWVPVGSVEEILGEHLEGSHPVCFHFLHESFIYLQN